MIAVLAEHHSDADALAMIIRQIIGNERACIRRKGFSGGGELCRKAASHIRLFAKQGVSRFVVCHDADGPDPEPARLKVKKEVVDCLDSSHLCGIVIPVQELEAWLIADEMAITKTIPSLPISAVSHPERIRSPKEWLVRESRRGRSKPLYSPVVHNPRVCKYLDLQKVATKCPSLKPLIEFVLAE
jgi:hypothetical protein